ncbi:CHAT domain-containing protein [Flavisolibacter sp. BT320]|nr:CHAT domain-containing protein [Flavisolibacter longurius]
MRLYLCFITLFLFKNLLHAQCLTSTETWNKIEALREPSLSLDGQIIELRKLQKQRLTCKETSDSAYAKLLQRLGALYHLTNNFSSAIQYSEEAITVGSINNGKNKPQHLVQSYFNLGNSYKESKFFHRSIEAFKRSIEYAASHTNGLYYKVLSYYNLANVYLRLGDYQQSILHAEKGAVLARQKNDLLVEALCLSEQAQSLTELKKHKEASATIHNAMAIMQDELGRNKEDNFLREQLANIYTVYARTLAAAKEPEQAIIYYNKALQLFRQTGFRYGSFSTLNNIGYTLTEMLQDNHKAKMAYNQALGYAVSSEDTVMYLNNIAVILYNEKKFQPALQYLQKALQRMPVKFSNSDPVSNPTETAMLTCANKVMLLTLITGKAETWLAYYHASDQHKHLQLALEAYRLADKVVDMMRYEQHFSESKLFWRSETHALYENAIEACRLLEDPSSAFYFFEKSKAVLLSDQLNEQNRMVKNSRDVLNKQVQLRTELTKWKRELDTVQEKNLMYDALVNKIFQGEQELSQLDQKLKQQNPYYFRNYVDSSFIPLAFLQKNILQEEQSLVEIFVGDSAVYSFYVTKSQAKLHKINKRDYESTVTRFNQYISNEALLNQQFTEFEETASRLYNLIFGNFALSPGRMIVSPDGQYFPFEALVKKRMQNSLTYFLQDHAVSYVYSARYLANNQNVITDKSNASFLGLAPVRYTSGWNLSTLVKSDESIQRISRLFTKESSLLYDKASRQNFLNGLHHHKVVQLYTHATDSGSTGEPVIYFADSLLYLSDLIAGEKPLTELIVLSACQTGSGQAYTGEGVFSFSRGFAAIGIPSSITNLWKVDNEATYRLTELFYTYLAEGHPTDIALQKAKSVYIASVDRKHQSPYYWAAMIHMGLANKFEMKRHTNWLPWVICAGFVFLCFIGIRRSRSQRKVNRSR